MCCITLDYVTGLTKAWMKKSLSSEVGLKGIVKKLSYLLGVGVGFAADLLISLAADSFGLPVELPALFGLMATLLLSLNELLSIVENLGRSACPCQNHLWTPCINWESKTIFGRNSLWQSDISIPFKNPIESEPPSAKRARFGKAAITRASI